MRNSADQIAGAYARGDFRSIAELAQVQPNAALAQWPQPVWTCLFRALVEQGLAPVAAGLFLQAAAMRVPGLPAPWDFSPVLRRLGEFDLDVTCWQQWSARFPDRVPARLQLAQSLLLADRIAEAAASLDEGVTVLPQAAALWAQLGMLRLRTGDRDGALAAWQEALRLEPAQPLWVGRGVSALERGCVELNGVVLEVPPAVVSASVLRFLVEGGYEARELDLLREVVRPGDRVLELGAGLGYLASYLGRHHPDVAVTVIEANPALLPVIQANLSGNGSPAQLLHGVASVREGVSRFYLDADFWGSSAEPGEPGRRERVEVPAIDVNAVIGEFRPTLLVVDIEGGELDLLPGLNLDSVDRLVVELHPDVYGHDGSGRVMAGLIGAGLRPDVQRSAGQVFLFVR